MTQAPSSQLKKNNEALPRFPSLQHNNESPSGEYNGDSNRTYFVCFLSQESHSSVLSDVQCLKPIFKYNLSAFLIVSEGRINVTPATLSWSKMKFLSQVLVLEHL